MYPNDLVLGGASLNAVDVAAGLRDRGHCVLVAAPDGELSSLVDDRQLQRKRVPAHVDNRPHPTTAAAIARIASAFGADIVHTWEFGPFLNSYFGPNLLRGVPQLSTVMSMEFPRSMPRTVPVTLGTRDLVAQAARLQRGPVWLLEPPIDLSNDRPELVDARSFGTSLGLDPELPTLAIVSRLPRAMKLEGIRDTVLAAGDLADRGIKCQLVVVGDGDGARDVSAAAEAVNWRVGRKLVVMTGTMEDPRPAYARADVVIGMGSSIIRGLAFARPGIVTGVEGFVLAVRPDTFHHFDRHGYWGVGTRGDRRRILADEVIQLLRDDDLRTELGTWGARLAHERYGLTAAVTRVAELYGRCIAHRVARRTAAGDALVTALKYTPRWMRSPYTAIRDRLVRA